MIYHYHNSCWLMFLSLIMYNAQRYHLIPVHYQSYRTSNPLPRPPHHSHYHSGVERGLEGLLHVCIYHIYSLYMCIYRYGFGMGGQNQQWCFVADGIRREFFGESHMAGVMTNMGNKQYVAGGFVPMWRFQVRNSMDGGLEWHWSLIPWALQ
jgi:hypothetical protein